MTPTTKLNWSAMSARDRDVLVAEHVMCSSAYHATELTSSKVHVFTIIDKLRAEGFVAALVNSVDGSWGCTFAKGWQRYSGTAATPSESVCLAALRAKGVEV